MDELISKKAVIEAIERARANVGHNLERSIGKSIIEILDDVGEDVGKLPSALGTNLAEVGTDVPDNNVGELISRQAALDALWKALFEYEDKTEKQFIERDDLDVSDWIGKYRGFVQNMSDIDRQVILNMPPAEPEHTCVNCGRTVNNGGWYADGRTRCPIEEHYALPKDGYCHLWEKRNVTDDDYPERRTDE